MRRHVDVERLGDEIAELSAHLHAATYSLLVRIRTFDEHDGWSGGFRSCAHWLSWRTGIDPGAARAKVRAARALLGDGIRVSAETSRRIACDATRVVMIHDAGGNVLDVGRRNRTVPVSIRRALEHRDRCCRFPGCTNRICDAHHVQHWADGGDTKLKNLLLLCPTHHRLVHEGGFRVRLNDAGETCFQRPDGMSIPNAPAAVALAEDAVVTLERAHSELGLEIDAQTTTPHWRGERLDVDMALMTMRRESPDEVPEPSS